MATTHFLSRQAQLAGISQSSVYYLPRPVNLSVQMRMRRIAQLHLEHLRSWQYFTPEYNGTKHVGTGVGLIFIGCDSVFCSSEKPECIYPKPKLSLAAKSKTVDK